MSFRERAAWVMGLLIAGAGLYYLYVVRDLGPAAPPTLAYFIMVLIAAGSVVVKLALAAWSQREVEVDYAAPSLAEPPADERERPLLDRAGNWSGWVLGIGVVGVLWQFSQNDDAMLMFHLLVGCLILAQFAEYAFQIILFRRSS